MNIWMMALLAQATFPATGSSSRPAPEASSRATSQDDETSPPQIEVTRVEDAGKVATSSAGETGERRTRDNTSPTGADPLARINNRLQSRVQSRIRNRIDRNYDPRANAQSPFIAAEDSVRPQRPR